MKYIIFVGLAALCSCDSPPKANILQQWSDSISNYGLLPVYPMREDVYVGDVRLAYTAESIAAGLNSRLIIRLPEIAAEMIEHQQSLPTYPEGSSATNSNSNNSTQVRTRVEYTASDFGSKGNRLRTASLPMISLKRFVQAGVGASGTASGLPFSLGADGVQDRLLKVDLIDVETVELDDVTLLRDFTQTVCNDNDVRKAIKISAQSRGGDNSGEGTEVYIVSRVFYLRGIDYSYDNDRAANIRVATSERPSDSISDQPPSTGEGAADPVSGGESVTIANPNGGQAVTIPAVTLANLLNVTPSVEGGLKTLATDKFITRERYKRPVAFAYDKLALNTASILKDCFNLEGQPAENTPAGTHQERGRNKP